MPALALEVVALFAGVMAVAALVYGSFLLLRETTLAVAVLRERTDSVRAGTGSGRHDRVIAAGRPT